MKPDQVDHVALETGGFQCIDAGFGYFDNPVPSKQAMFRHPQHHSSHTTHILTPARAGGAAGMPVCLR